MKPTLELFYLALGQHLLLPERESAPTVLTAFRPGDVVLMNSIPNEQAWLAVAQAGMQPGIRLLVDPSDQSADQVAKRIRKEKVTVLITTTRHWVAVYSKLNQQAGAITRLKVVLVDTPTAPEARYALLLRALSRAKIENTYEAYQKAPWIQQLKRQTEAFTKTL